MLTSWRRLFLLTSALGVCVSLVLVSLAVWFATVPRPVTSRTSPVDVEAQYERQLEPIGLALRLLTEQSLGSGDGAELAGLRQQLLALTVPAEAREFHLSLVFGLQRLEDALATESSEQDGVLERVQAELTALVISHEW
ncbi:MAG: hypothetical protein U1C53_03245 [Candidatus Veblenbacteria bacterium]|nr:hypothetical protein [Candidatus Veblenbacteria bacterium]MDZ4230130.1 hypothetical protein [Candidatus Veblenbacteria bacterium]